MQTVYAENVTTDAGQSAIQQTTITQPVVGEATTSIVVTVVSGSVPGDTNAIPANGAVPPPSSMPNLPGLPPGAVPLPPAP